MLFIICSYSIMGWFHLRVGWSAGPMLSSRQSWGCEAWPKSRCLDNSIFSRARFAKMELARELRHPSNISPTAVLSWFLAELDYDLDSVCSSCSSCCLLRESCRLLASSAHSNSRAQWSVWECVVLLLLLTPTVVLCCRWYKRSKISSTLSTLTAGGN